MTNKKIESSINEVIELDPRDATIEELNKALESAKVDFGCAKSEIRRLNSENETTVSVCNENTDLKRQLTDLSSAAASYLSLDGSDKIYDAVKLQGARVKLREEIQRAKEATQ